ncbi:hypothetical protein UPYG_G00195970 [Umbra pygmaea]|uniref:Uncharacterized protein n=1 Tax=Umbra pygmaea TaxID=75934 RepID=A0ABD0X7N3_UMBPY
MLFGAEGEDYAETEVRERISYSHVTLTIAQPQLDRRPGGRETAKRRRVERLPRRLPSEFIPLKLPQGDAASQLKRSFQGQPQRETQEPQTSLPSSPPPSLPPSSSPSV